MNIMAKGERYNKVRSFFKVMGCPKPNSVKNIRPQGRILDNKVELSSNHFPVSSSKLIQTDLLLHENSCTQTEELVPIIKSSNKNIEEFKRIIDTNHKIYERNLLLETKRFYLSRFAFIISSRINNILCISLRLLGVNFKGLRNNFINVLVRILNVRIEKHLNLCLYNLYKSSLKCRIKRGVDVKYCILLLVHTLSNIIRLRKLYVLMKLIYNIKKPRVRFDPLTIYNDTSRSSGKEYNILNKNNKGHEYNIVSQLDFFTKEPFIKLPNLK